jgi:short-subunit dehydrogenase/acyl carrier protein/acyl dehydratase
MVTIQMFSNFEIGQYVNFSRQFCQNDFESFSKLSGDANPLHHDVSYAKDNAFENPIVPLHLVAAPLSAIAGMGLPGASSLYLHHNVRAIKPVLYDNDVHYSARIQRIDATRRVLELSVVCFQFDEVVMQAEMIVQSRSDKTAFLSKEMEIRGEMDGAEALITGASGGIGRAVARKMASSGWNLILLGRSLEKLAPVQEMAKKFGVEVLCVEADFEDSDSLAKCEKIIRARPNIVSLVHAACAPINATPKELFSTNADVFAKLIDASIAQMLNRQFGRIIFLGSAAQLTHPKGMENYTHAKAAGTSLVNQTAKRFSEFGIAAYTVAPSYVATSFSKGFQPDGVQASEPEEIANCISGIIEKRNVEKSDSSFIRIDTNGIREGCFSWFDRRPDFADTAIGTASSEIDTEPQSSDEDIDATQLPAILREISQFLNIRGHEAFDMAELGVTPGWDSLRHIELMLFLEKAFGISFDANEIETTRTLKRLAKLISTKLES